MKNNIAIQVENASFEYQKGNTVVSDMSFSIKEGAIAMLIGPNGSGKTTLLKGLVGLLKPIKGRIRIYGKNSLSNRHIIGYVPQTISFDKTFPITVSEFLQTKRNVTDEEIHTSLQQLDIDFLFNEKIGTLSGGQLQRVLIARSMLGKPKILFLDEPVSGIDIGGEENFYDLIHNIQKQHNVTIVMVSHEVHLVSKIADHVICINKNMICSGVPNDTLSPEIINKLYGHNVSTYKHKCL